MQRPSKVQRRKTKMDNTKSIRFSAASLITLSGAIHLALAVTTTGMELATNASFGLLYVIIGIGLFLGRRLFSYIGAVFPILGAIIGAYAYATLKPETIFLPLIAIDIIVILCCFYLILHKASP
jgi:hypothetical protein